MSEPKKARRVLHLLVGVGLSGLFLYLALRGEDWGAIRASLADARPGWLALMAPTGVYVLFVRSQRWRMLLEKASGEVVPVWPVFSANAIGFMANMVLPFRVGDFARPYLVSRSTKVGLSTTVATVVIERVLDLFALFCFAVYVILVSPTPQLVKQFTAVAGGLALVSGGGAWVLSKQRARFQPLLNAVFSVLPDRAERVLHGLVDDFLSGMASISEPRVLAAAILWSLYTWLLVAVSFSLGFPAFSIDVPFLQGGVTVATIVALAVAVPGAPGFVGQFEYGCKLSLEGILGVEGGRVIGYALVVHAIQFAVQVATGLVFLVREGLSLSDLGHIEDEVAGASSAESGAPESQP